VGDSDRNNRCNRGRYRRGDNGLQEKALRTRGQNAKALSIFLGNTKAGRRESASETNAEIPSDMQLVAQFGFRPAAES
jgi:hypothetical protein